MENSIKVSEAQVLEGLLFIKEFHQLEKMSYETAYDVLDNIFLSKPSYQRDHIKSHWKYKKRNFGDFFGNLDVDNRICFYNSLGIIDSDDEKYFIRTKENPIAKLILIPSNTYVRLNNLIVYFHNHGINEKPSEWLELDKLPIMNNNTGSFNKKSPRYGDSKNWAKYILSLSSDEQSRVVKTILENYQIDNYK